uniref:Protein arginine methyltransferase NDUFAF7 n=1 Tax=Panagrolaimus sp. PS1159 TaxID=55785 RepID=A0AC35FTV5_9BILA
MNFIRHKSTSKLFRQFSTCQRLKKEVINPYGRKTDEALHLFIRDKIKSNGPITVHEFMQLVSGSAAGYYVNKSRDEGKIFGPSGDFITAPELTQVFGELLAVWIYNELGNCGHTDEWQLVEFGPGTGNLMSQLLGAFKKFKEEDKLTVHFVEISDALIDEQEKKLCNNVTKNIEGKSYVRKNRSLYEAGTIVNQITEKVLINGGFALFVDYGHDGGREELSLRAYHKHALVDPLSSPGRNDITADVNFGYLKSLVEDRVLVYGPQEQRWFLSQLGILTRMQYLMSICKSKEDRENLFNAYKLLMTGTEHGGMGAAFKTFSIFPKTLQQIMEKRGGYPDGFRPFGMKIVEKKVLENEV